MARLALLGLLVLSALPAVPHDLPAQPKPKASDQAPAVKRADSLTFSELNTLIGRIQECWTPPVGIREVPDLVVTLRISLARDGSLAQYPVVVNSSPHPLFQSAAQSAIRALRKCAPFNFLPVAKYENWKSIDINFVSRDLLKDK